MPAIEIRWQVGNLKEKPKDREPQILRLFISAYLITRHAAERITPIVTAVWNLPLVTPAKRVMSLENPTSLLLLFITDVSGCCARVGGCS